MYEYLYLSIYPSIYLSIYLSLSVYLSILHYLQCTNFFERWQNLGTSKHTWENLVKSLTIELLYFAVEQKEVSRFYLNVDLLIAKILLGFTLKIT